MTTEAIHGAIQLDLAHHLKSLNLLRPLIALEQNKGRIDAPSDLCEGVDIQYLCLTALDVMMENTTVGSGATVHEVLAKVSGTAERMKKSLTSAQSQVIARYVLDGLTNAREKFSTFTASYYHAPSDTLRVHQYRLVQLGQDIDDVLRYSLTDEGFVVYMGMLNLPPDIYIELMEKALEILLQRGKFDDALNVAKQARISALSFSQQIRSKLKAAEAAPGSVRWSEVNASLQLARIHVTERQREDLRLEEQVRDALRIAEESSSRMSLAQILDTIKGASSLRTRLVQDISGAGERYRAASQAVFTARHYSSLPGLQDTLLPRAMTLSVELLSANADRIVATLFTPVHPVVPSLAAVVDLLSTEKIAPAAPAKDDGIVVPYVDPAPQFSEGLVQEVQEWLPYRTAGSPGLPVLVVENHNTFWSFGEWNTRVKRYSAVAYGAGNGFSGAAAGLAEVLRETGGTSVDYLGDLDPKGMRIPLDFNKAAAEFGLSVAPASEFYAWLVEHGTQRTKPDSPLLPDGSAQAWLGPTLGSLIDNI